MKKYWNSLSTAKKTKLVVYVVLSLTVLIFSLRNWQDTTLHIFFTKMQVPTTVLIFISMAAGYGIARVLDFKKMNKLNDQIDKLNAEKNLALGKLEDSKNTAEEVDSE